MSKWAAQIFAALSLGALPLPAAEIYTNGNGGGDWDAPATWRGNQLPGMDDEAVIRRGDHVTFARRDEDKLTCKQLSIDPLGSFTLKPRAGKVVASFAGPVLSYGAILLDGTQNPDDHLEIRLLTDDNERRKMNVQKGGSLMLVGYPNLPENRRNVVLASLPAKPTPNDPTGVVTVEDGCILDARHVLLNNVRLTANNLDNTGAKANERLQVIGCRFENYGRLALYACDTAVVTDNVFVRSTDFYNETALLLNSVALAEVRNNTIKGAWYYGINGAYCTDATVVQNSVEGCHTGVYWLGDNAMIQDLTVRKANIGIMFNYFSGAVDKLTTDECVTPIYQASGRAQVSNWRVLTPPKSNRLVDFDDGELVLVNCECKPENVEMPPKPRSLSKEVPPPPLVQAMAYLVVGLKGQSVPGASVDVVPTQPDPAVPAGALDTRVRNAPAAVMSNGMTPLPGTFEGLLTRTWKYEIDGKLHPAQPYQVNVMGPAAGNEAPKVLKTVTVTPDDKWFRPEPDANVPTVEVTLP